MNRQQSNAIIGFDLSATSDDINCDLPECMKWIMEKVCKAQFDEFINSYSVRGRRKNDKH